MAAPSQLVGHMLGHYRIIEQIGAGGMGVVYRAHDEQLERDVAIKVLPTGTLSDEAARKRFRKEALALAKLNHPNIATIFEFGTHNSTDYLVTEYISGQTLDEKLTAGALSEKEVVGLGIQLAEGLSAAHEHGIVHRDLKPANLRLTPDGRLKILDFGLAQLMPQASEIGMTATLTQSQEVTGTLPYMAPEQLRGGVADARTDIWAAGAVLYEVATAHRPFEEKVPTALAGDIIHKAPSSPRRFRSELSPMLEAVILKCLKKEPTDRYQSAHQLQTDLERISTGVTPLAARRRLWPVIVSSATVLVMLAVGAFFYVHRSPKLTDKDTLVLADFDNRTGDPVFDDTLNEALKVDIGQSPYLNVVSEQKVGETTKLMGMKPGQRVVGKLAAELCQRTGNKAMLAGSIANIGSQYVIGLEALDCATGDLLAREQVRANRKEEVLQGLDKVVAITRERLGESLASLKKFDKPLTEVTTSSLPALQFYSEGKKVQAQRGNLEALSYFNHAVELDPNFAAAYQALGHCYGNVGESNLSKESIKKAFGLRSQVSEREKFSIAADYYSHVTGELDKAGQQYELLLQHYPRDGEAHNNLGGIYSDLGDHERAAKEALAAAETDPDNGIYWLNLASDYLDRNRLDEAKATLQKALQRNPDFFPLHNLMYYVGFLQGDEILMEQQISWAAARPNAEVSMLVRQAEHAVYLGNLNKSRKLYERIVETYSRKSTGVAAFREAQEALWESEFGNARRARQAAKAAITLAPEIQAQVIAALAFARAGETFEATAIEHKLNKQRPLDTLMQNYWLPTLRAQNELNHGNAKHAVEFLQATSAYDLSGVGFMLPVYVRGHAYLLANDAAQAVAQFQKVLDHPGVTLGSPLAPLARLGLARAYRVQGDTEKSRIAYKNFFTLWKDADPDIPILKEAKAEYEKLK